MSVALVREPSAGSSLARGSSLWQTCEEYRRSLDEYELEVDDLRGRNESLRQRIQELELNGSSSSRNLRRRPTSSINNSASGMLDLNGRLKTMEMSQ